MANLYMSAQSDDKKTETTRTAHRIIKVHVRSWGVGVYVVGHRYKDGTTLFAIHRTKGSEIDEDGEVIENLGDLEFIHAFKEEG